jgi:predicted  nucleic acid-binding Zn-ribbon protein
MVAKILLKMNTELTLLISNILTGISTYLLGRRKNNAETDNLVLLNLEKSILLYKNMIDDLKIEIRELNLKIQELEKKVDDLMTENRILKDKL